MRPLLQSAEGCQSRSHQLTGDDVAQKYLCTTITHRCAQTPSAPTRCARGPAGGRLHPALTLHSTGAARIITSLLIDSQSRAALSGSQVLLDLLNLMRTSDGLGCCVLGADARVHHQHSDNIPSSLNAACQLNPTTHTMATLSGDKPTFQNTRCL